MLDQKEIKEKTFKLVDQFKEHLRNKEGRKAVCAYQQALELAFFCEFSQADKLYLFGDQTEGIDGAFKQSDVSKAHEIAFQQELRHFQLHDKPVEPYCVRFVHI